MVEEYMLKYDTHAITYRELPNEVALSFSITSCPFQCSGCHSPHLRCDIGHDNCELKEMIAKYHKHITAICFLGHGGDNHKEAFTELLKDIKSKYNLKVGVYSGYPYPFEEFLPYVDYYKVGPYIQERGALDDLNTNQVYYEVKGDELINKTYLFQNPRTPK